MNWDAIGAVGEIVGALAVVLTIAYLATQIRLTREMERAASTRNTLAKAVEVMTYSSSHPGSFETLRKGIRDYAALTVSEKDIFHGWATHYVLSVEQAMYMSQTELLPQESWVVWQDFGVALISSSGGSQWWEDYQHVFNQEMVEKLKARVLASNANQEIFYRQFPHWKE